MSNKSNIPGKSGTTDTKDATTNNPKPNTKASDLQSLLRFLTTSASIPLARALPLAAPLHAASLASPSSLATASQATIANALTSLPSSERTKIARQLQSAAKRALKTNDKRALDADADADSRANDVSSKRSRREPAPSTLHRKAYPKLPAPTPIPKDREPREFFPQLILQTNRAPLLLAFAVVSLAYTMPEQPEESRLSLGMGVVSAVAEKKGRELGVGGFEGGVSAKDFGGRTVKVMGLDVPVLRREMQQRDEKHEEKEEKEEEEEEEREPAYWALNPASTDPLPIHTPEYAHAYLLKSFKKHVITTSSSTKTTTNTKETIHPTTQHTTLPLLLSALHALFSSWAPHLSKAELGARGWAWYVRVRPEVGEGRAGWGAKGEVRLADLLALRRVVSV